MIEIKVFEGVSSAAFSGIPCDFSCSICDILQRIGDVGVNIDMISSETNANGEISIGFTFSDDDLPKLVKVVKEEKTPPMISCGNVKFVVKSSEMVNTPGFAAKMFAALNGVGCSPLLVTTSLDEISLLVRSSDSTDAEAKLRELFDIK